MAVAETPVTGPLEFRRSRWKAWGFLLIGLFMLVAGIAMAADVRSLASFGVVAFALALTTFFGWQARLAGEVAIIVDDDGIEDRRFRMRVRWDEIESARQVTHYSNGKIHRSVSLRIKEERWPDVSKRWPHKLQRKMARFGGMRSVSIQTNLLDARPKKVATTILERARAKGIPT